MATFNGAPFLQDQLQSILDQTLRPAELHIGDDGSTDATEEIVRQFTATAPFEVQFHRNRSPLGYGENFIRTALRCSGEWIAFCDQDDIWCPNKLGRCADEIIQGPPDTALVVHDAEIVGETLERSGRRLYGFRGSAAYPPLSQPPEWYCLGLTQVFRAMLLRDLPSSPRVSFPWHDHREAHDVWISLLANLLGTIRIVPEPLVLYRRHEGATSTTGSNGNPRAAMLGAHGENFGERSAYLNDVAKLLSTYRASATEEVGSKLGIAIEELRQQAAFLELRSTAYTGSTMGVRFRALADLLAGGGYFGRNGWPFGSARLAKDMLYAALGPSSGR